MCRYGLRYTAKVLRDTLKTKFPEANEDELYKVTSRVSISLCWSETSLPLCAGVWFAECLAEVFLLFSPQIVGNLVYYRYMNPAVVAPDGFDVVDRSAGSTLQPEQRHILGSIARMLQHAAARKHFHGDGPHITALNQYISQTHAKFRSVII